MSALTWAAVALAALLAAERLWRHARIARFFRRATPRHVRPPALVSILQPILSGDPTLEACLEANLTARCGFPREFLYLVDDDDAEAHRVCRALVGRHPEATVALLSLPRPAPGANPKTVKLIAGARAARGDVLCVLDDDTVLPDGGLEACLPHLDVPGVGVAFGLPYYAHFANGWSSLVSLLVNATSLATYIPYTALTEPFTINGMFYAVRRETLDAVGGFDGLEGTLADDFAVARRFRERGYRLAQTPLTHAVRTHVRDAGHYASLLRRWFTFPRESVLRHVTPRERAVAVGLGVVGNVLPLALLAIAVAANAPAAWGAAAAYFALDLALIAWRGGAYLGGATPWWGTPLTPLVLLAFPLQMLAALLWPHQRVNWRGHVMEAERGGGGAFRTVRRRTDGP